MLRGLSLDVSAVVLIALAVVATAVAYWKDPGLPLLGPKSLAFPVIAGWLVKLYYHE